MIQKFLRVCRWFQPTPIEKVFLKERKRHFRRGQRRFPGKSRSVLLVEMTSDVGADRIVPLSTFLDAFQRERAGSKIIGFVPDLVLEPALHPLLSWLRDVALYHAPSRLRRIYRACGVHHFQLETVSPRRTREARTITSVFLEQNPSKEKVLRWAINGIRVGDLLYDHFLRAYRRPTLEVADPLFQAFAIRFVSMFLFWERFFQSTSISGVVAQNQEYGMGIPLRMALGTKSPGFYLQMDSVVTVSDELNNPHNVKRHNLRKELMSLGSSERLRARELAEARLATRLGGGIDPRIGYMPSSAFSPARTLDLIEDSNRTNVLIASHCFYDASHFYGENVFPDFWEWLQFLGSQSVEHDFDWYLKEHPNFSQTERRFIKEFIAECPSIRLLPANVSNLQLVEEGLTAVITVYGSVGHEFPALGVPVINCSLNNPHIEWNFSFHAADVNSLDSLIREIPHLQVKPSARDEIVDFFAAQISRASLEEPLFLREKNLGFGLVGRGHDDAITHQWVTELRSGAYEGTVSELQNVVARSMDKPTGVPLAAVFSRGKARILS